MKEVYGEKPERKGTRIGLFKIWTYDIIDRKNNTLLRE